ncbi:complement C1q-like protein 2 [Sardina pilchardus]|uniref:complement C1q-like protein 2 n=1 Tax=Sardina pilchardus TaxID=27697 RepID=UPI002E11F321
MLAHTLLVLTALVLAHGAPQERGDTDASSQLLQLKALVEELKNTTQDQADELKMVKDRLAIAEKDLKEMKDVPKIAFSASLGGDGLFEAGSSYKTIIYKNVITNIGEAYDDKTGKFTVPVRGVYYVRMTANGPTEKTISSVLYKGQQIILIVHEQPSGEGSDTASNGATFLLEKGDQLHVKLWPNTHIWDNSGRFSTITAFLLYPMPA